MDNHHDDEDGGEGCDLIDAHDWYRDRRKANKPFRSITEFGPFNAKYLRYTYHSYLEHAHEEARKAISNGRLVAIVEVRDLLSGQWSIQKTFRRCKGEKNASRG